MAIIIYCTNEAYFNFIGHYYFLNMYLIYNNVPLYGSMRKLCIHVNNIKYIKVNSKHIDNMF